MSDDLCSKCRGSLQSGWVACPHCGVSLGAGTAVEVTGDDNITVVGNKDVSIKTGDSTRTSTESGDIHQGDVHHHGADPQVVADLMKRVEALDTTPQLTPQTSDDSAEPELRMALAQGLLRDVLDGKLNREMIQGIPTLRVLCEQLYGSDYLEQD